MLVFLRVFLGPLLLLLYMLSLVTSSVLKALVTTYTKRETWVLTVSWVGDMVVSTGFFGFHLHERPPNAFTTRSLSHRRFCWRIPYPTTISSLKMPLKCIPLSLFLERVPVLVLVIYFCLDPSLLPIRLCSQSHLPCCTWREFPQT